MSFNNTLKAKNDTGQKRNPRIINFVYQKTKIDFNCAVFKFSSCAVKKNYPNTDYGVSTLNKISLISLVWFLRSILVSNSAVTSKT